MCFSATANFVGSGVLATIGVATLIQVKDRREILFASLPALFAVHQFIEGFVWLGLDGILSPAVTHNMAQAYILFAQGLAAVSYFRSASCSSSRTPPAAAACCPSRSSAASPTLYMLWGLMADPLRVYVEQNSIVYVNDATNHTTLAVLYVICTCGSLFFSRVRAMIIFGAVNLSHPAHRHGGQKIRLHLGLVRLRRRRQHHHPRLLLEEPRHLRPFKYAAM
jgi:hypothetical protein